jgi:hypothetical protein
MKSASQIRQKVKQVTFRLHLKRQLKEAFRRLPERCVHNRVEVDLGLCSLQDPPEGLRVCDPGSEEGEERASKCSCFDRGVSKEKVRETIKDQLQGLLSAPLAEIARTMPDVAALMWVLDEEAPADEEELFEQQLAELSWEMETLRTELSSTKEKHEAELGGVKEEHRTQIEEMGLARMLFDAGKLEAAEAFQERLGEGFEALEKAVSDQLEKESSRLRSSMKGRAEDQRKHQVAVVELKRKRGEELEGKIAEMWEKHEAKVKELTEAHQSELEALQESEGKAREEALEELREVLRGNHKVELTAIATENQKELDSLHEDVERMRTSHEEWERQVKGEGEKGDAGGEGVRGSDSDGAQLDSEDHLPSVRRSLEGPRYIRARSRTFWSYLNPRNWFAGMRGINGRPDRGSTEGRGDPSKEDAAGPGEDREGLA